MAISSSSSSSSSDNKVQNCSKQCLESFKTLQKNFDSEREKHNRAKLEIRGYEIALESLESRILGHEKNELAWGEKYEFQNYELKCREIKINNLNLELEKVVKERDELKLKIEKWEGSSKNLTKILNSQMSTHDKNGLGFGTQMDDLSNKSETDSENRKLLNPRAEHIIFEFSEYAFRNKIIESQITELNIKTSETFGKTNDANIEKPKSVSESVVSNPKIDRDRVIIEDWNSNDEKEEYEVQTVRHETQTVKTGDDKSGQNSKKQGIGFKKVKTCFVCKSTDHLIKDYHSVSTARPVCTARPSVSTARPVCTARPSVSTARPSVSTARPVCTARPSVSTARPVCTARPVYATRPIYPRMDNGNPEILLQDHAVVDMGCSSHCTRHKAYLSLLMKDFNGGFVALEVIPKGVNIRVKNIVPSGWYNLRDICNATRNVSKYIAQEIRFSEF
ncbi:hypothetical protein Tco_1357473 [Tanacetum coccineum]